VSGDAAKWGYIHAQRELFRSHDEVRQLRIELEKLKAENAALKEEIKKLHQELEAAKKARAN
jgi:cell division protein FtsB